MKRSEVALRLQILARPFAALILIGVGMYLRFGLPDSLLVVGGLVWADAWLESWFEARPRRRVG